MFSKKTVIIIGIIILAAVSVIGISVSGRRGVSSYGQGIALFFVAPFQEITARSLRFAKDIWNHYFFLSSSAKAGDRLRKELNDAIEKISRYDEIEHSNSRLRSLLNFRRTINGQVLAAEVIGKDPSPWFKSIIINKGSADGIKKGMPAVMPEGIAGLVSDISRNYSRVLLITDQNSAVDALVQRTRARGIVKGESDRCLFEYVLRKHDIVEGDTVISSGLDGVFPKGLRVGYVSRVTKRNSGIFQDVTVIPYCDFEKLEEVLVILDPPGISREDEQFPGEQ